MKKRNIKINQRGVGFSFYLIVSMLFVVSFFSYFSIKIQNSYGDLYTESISRKELMINLKSDIEDYYKSHDYLSYKNINRDVEKNNIIKNLKIPSSSAAHVKIELSNIINSDKISWRDIVVWIPARDGLDGSSYNINNNTFSKGDKDVEFFVFSGKNIEYNKILESNKKLDDLDKILSSYFLNKVKNDFTKDMGINYFNGCLVNEPFNNGDLLNCTDFFTDILKMNASESIGLNYSNVLSPWGNQVEMINGDVDVLVDGKTYRLNSTKTPYTMAISIKMPNDKRITKIIRQPL